MGVTHSKPGSALFFKVKTSVEALCAEHPALDTNFGSFVKSHASDALEIFSRYGTKP
jgi:hypothetical protein